MKQRWYDKHPLLAEHLKKLMSMEPRRREKIATGILQIINETAPDLLAMPFFKSPPKEIRKRWYDKEPLIWLAMNVPKYLDEGNLRKVMDYLAEEIECKTGS
jgi:hypothetical protein